MGRLADEAFGLEVLPGGGEGCEGDPFGGVLVAVVVGAREEPLLRLFPKPSLNRELMRSIKRGCRVDEREERKREKREKRRRREEEKKRIKGREGEREEERGRRGAIRGVQG